MTKPKALRRPAALLLVLWTFQACTTVRDLPGPRPNQGFDGIVLHSGERIVFPSSYRGALEDSVVVVRRLRDDSVVESYRAADVSSVIDRDVNRPATIGAVLIGGLVVTVLFASMLSGTSYSE